MRVRLVLAWYDAWVGVFYDRERKRLYVLPLPCVGLRFDLAAGRLDQESGR